MGLQPPLVQITTGSPDNSAASRALEKFGVGTVMHRLAESCDDFDGCVQLRKKNLETLEKREILLECS